MTRALVAFVLVAQSALAAAEPAPGRVLVANFSGPRPLAAPVTALLRARLQRAGRAALGETELRAAGVPATIEAGTERAHAALTAAGADLLVVGDVAEKDGAVTIAARSYGADGLPHGAAAATVAEPDVGAGVETVAAQLAKDAGLQLDGNAHATLAELAPFADIDLLARADAKEAARLLAVADPAVAARIPDARAAALRVADQASLPIALRLRAVLAAGTPDRAAELTTGARLDDEAKALAARAAALASHAALPAGGKSAEWAVTRADRALAEADIKAAATAIAPYVTKGALPSVLAIVSRLPAGALGDAEPKVLASLADAPTLAEPLVARAAGKVPDEALATAPLGMLTTITLKNLAPTAQKGGPLAAAIATELDRRAKATAATAPPPAPATPRPRPPVAAPVEPTAPVATPSHESAPPAVVAVAKELLPLLDGLGPLPRAGGRAVFVRVEAKDVVGASQSFDADLLQKALRYAVSHDPYALKVVDGEGRAELTLKATPSLPRGRLAIALALVDHQSGKTDEASLALPGLTATLVHVRILFWLAVLALVAGLLGGGAFAFFYVTRVGSLRVDVTNDLRSSRDTFAIRVTRSARAPEIADPERFDADERKHGPRTTRRRRSLAAGTTEFSPLQVGTWHVHLFGLYVRDGQTYQLPALTRRVHVNKGEQAYYRFELKHNAATVRLAVKDGKPVAGAVIEIDSTAEVIYTGPTGEATALLPPGEHNLVFEARGMKLSRAVHVADPPAPIELVVDFMAARNAANATKENVA